jgi:ribonuclease D
LIQISAGDGNAHLVQFEQGNYDAPNLKKLLTNKNILKIFHFARFDLASLQHYLKIEIENIYCTKIASRLIRTYTDSHGLKSICEEYGWNIEVKSQFGEGSTFIVTFNTTSKWKRN